MNFSKIEKEVIFLKAVKEIIDSMVNYEVLDIGGSDPDSIIRFGSIFNITYYTIQGDVIWR